LLLSHRSRGTGLEVPAQAGGAGRVANVCRQWGEATDASWTRTAIRPGSWTAWPRGWTASPALDGGRAGSDEAPEPARPLLCARRWDRVKRRCRPWFSR